MGSWKLSGQAVRLATELDLHTAFFKEPETYETHQRARMWYMLYVCDHHLSILYGRSSIMRDSESYITGWEQYLSCPLAVNADRRIAGQICLMYLMNQIRETLGPEDNSAPLPPSSIDDIVRFEANLDDWIARFSRHNQHELIGQWPNKGAIMHYHWAKLYLTSYSLRGLPESNAVMIIDIHVPL